MKSKKGRLEEIGSEGSVTKIRVVNIRRVRFAPDPKQLKNKSADLKNPTDPAQALISIRKGLYSLDIEIVIVKLYSKFWCSVLNTS